MREKTRDKVVRGRFCWWGGGCCGGGWAGWVFGCYKCKNVGLNHYLDTSCHTIILSMV